MILANMGYVVGGWTYAGGRWQAGGPKFEFRTPGISCTKAKAAIFDLCNRSLQSRPLAEICLNLGDHG